MQHTKPDPDSPGIERATTQNLNARIEYIYDDYDSKDYTIYGPYTYKANVD